MTSTLLKIGAIILVNVTLFVGGICIGKEMARPEEKDTINFHESRESTSTLDYKFIDPLLGCSVSGPAVQQSFLSLRKQVQDLIDDKISHNEATKISLYLDTRDGRGMSINTEERYSPASMLKVPEMIAFYKMAQTNPLLLKKELTFDGKSNLSDEQFFKPTTKLIPHTAYSIDDLIGRMIAYSDNNTLPLLEPYLDQQQFKKVFSDLGILLPNDSAQVTQDFISVQTYANFFRVLYNASYLNRDFSEKALALLSTAEFPEGLVAGIPAGVPLAQKFGERNFINDPPTSTVSKELHDCGVIYAPGHPYLLCIMTKGTDFKKLATVIGSISKLVYDTVHEGIQK